MIPGGLDLLKNCVQNSKKKSPVRLTPTEWLEKIPCKVYDSDENKSYLVICVSNEGVWYEDSIEMYDEDSFFGSGYYDIDCPRLMKFQDMSFNLVFGQEPTEKQVDWLENRGLMTKSMTKQEAWVIINNAVKKAQTESERRKQAARENYIRKQFNNMFDDDDIISQCGGCIDDEVGWTY